MDPVAKAAATCQRNLSMQMTPENAKKVSLILLSAVQLLLPAFGFSQSLGEIARQYRQEREAREKRGEVPVRVFTNDDIARMTASDSTAGPTKPGLTPQEENRLGPRSGHTVTTTPSTPSTQQVGAKQDNAKSKEYWQARFKAARAALSRAEEEQTLVEDELRLLQIRQARELDRDRSRKLNTEVDAKNIELESRRTATEKARSALNELEKEFKQSGAPQDWMDGGKKQE
ncbi:MAG TPA: hypothetical protein VFC10_01355 [Terriglobia bacterium]|jgi:hypothetical protein|nr:hypothetical protein [Terriglobia bacterium]